jgi:hypothetical protein
MSKTKIMLAAITGSVFIFNLSAAEISKTFKPTKDSWITNEKAGKPGSREHRSYGACKYLSVDTQYSGKKSHILLEFDLNEIPKGAKLASAFLVMGPKVKPSVGGPKAIEIRRLLKDDWKEGKQGAKTHRVKKAASWIASSYSTEGAKKWDKPGALGEQDSDAKGAVVISGAEIKDLAADGVDVLDLLNAWNKKRDIQFGLLIRTTNDKINYLRWASSNAGKDKGPQLVVTYSKDK